jgi:ribosomal protein S6--L-glutamate ligase
MRCWVVGNEVVAAFRRFSTDKDIRSNYSISHEGEVVELTKQEKDLAVKAAKVAGLGICGVDIARDINQNNKPIIYEINGCADLKGIETVTKISVATEIIKYVENNVGVTLPSQNIANEPIKQAVLYVTLQDIEELRNG